MTKRLSRSFYQREVTHLARSLIGQRLVRIINDQRVSGIIVETEAYLGIPDKAAHTCNGRRTPRNESMWGNGGHAYVYFTYGMHHCMNIVAGQAGDPTAALVRALEPNEGIDLMHDLRNGNHDASNLCAGPAKLCQALAIDRELDGMDLVHSDTLFVEKLRQRAYPKSHIVTGPRVGIAYAEEWTQKPLRFSLKDNPCVSKSR